MATATWKLAVLNASKHTRKPTDDKNHIRQALSASGQALFTHMSQSRVLDLHHEHSISFLAQLFCMHVQMPGSALLSTIVTRYFQHMGVTQLRVNDFAMELSSLVWALCYASPDKLLKYVSEIYNKDTFCQHAIHVDTCTTMLEDMYGIYYHNEESKQQLTNILQQLQDYTTAVEACAVKQPEGKLGNGLLQSPASATTVQSAFTFKSTTSSAPTVTSRRASPAPPASPPSLPCDVTLVLPSLSRKAAAANTVTGSTATEAALSGGSIVPHLRRRGSNESSQAGSSSSSVTASCDKYSIFVAASSSGDDGDDDEDISSVTTTSTGGSTSTNNSTAPLAQGEIHVQSLLRFYKRYPSKLWPLKSLQARLRSVYFGAQYWAQASSLHSEVLAFDESLFLFVVDLRALYLSEHAPLDGTSRQPRQDAKLPEPTQHKKHSREEKGVWHSMQQRLKLNRQHSSRRLDIS